MFIFAVSECKGSSIKRTRRVLDSYLIRVGRGSWSGPITQEGLNALRKDLRKEATKNTSIVVYKNQGIRLMAKLFNVGRKNYFNSNGECPVGSIKMKTPPSRLTVSQKQIACVSSAMGYVHDLGKASVQFQNKLRLHQPVSDPVRHEWLSAKILQILRSADSKEWDFIEAWNDSLVQSPLLTFGRADADSRLEGGLKNADEAIDFGVYTHHGLFNSKYAKNNESAGCSGHWHPSYLNGLQPPSEQFTAAKNTLSDVQGIKRCLNLYQKQRSKITEHQSHDYWKGVSLIARACLIIADSKISSVQKGASFFDDCQLFANTLKNGGLNQSLAWHLEQVGDESGQIAYRIFNHNFPVCDLDSVDKIQRSSAAPFEWQNKAFDYLLQKVDSSTPSIIFNTAGTGTGKTRMNIRALSALRSELRVSIALNLRSLTLQTGSSLAKQFALDDSEIATVIGDHELQRISQEDVGSCDEDGNEFESENLVFGEDRPLPEWLSYMSRDSRSSDSAKIINTPILVSTIDYLIKAGEPDRRNDHVKALLRVMSSDLVLDEIDSYEPGSLVAVGRLIQMAALFGRNVVCSSATLSEPVAKTIFDAYFAGAKMRSLIFQSDGVSEFFNCVFINDQINPDSVQVSSFQPFDFQSYYQSKIQDLVTLLAAQESSGSVKRMAYIQPLTGARLSDWHCAVDESIYFLTQNHSWQLTDSSKVSFGLIRVANIPQAIELAERLSQSDKFKVACYHSRDWMLSRFNKERLLDRYLTRSKGDSKLKQMSEIHQLVGDRKELHFIVVATPVEEIGRDHDFDWGVLDVSSSQSIVQAAGRINRHRQIDVSMPNISILGRNYRSVKNHNSLLPCFVYPGYENKSTPYPHTVQDLIFQSQDKEKTQHFCIDARLRFDRNEHLLAKLDDDSISAFLNNKTKYFFHNSSEGEDLTASMKFMCRGVYAGTRLRDINQTKDYYMKFSDESEQPDLYFLEAVSRSRAHPFGVKETKDSYSMVDFGNRYWLSLSLKDSEILRREYDLTQKVAYSFSIPEYLDSYGNPRPIKILKIDNGLGILQDS